MKMTLSLFWQLKVETFSPKLFINSPNFLNILDLATKMRNSLITLGLFTFNWKPNFLLSIYLALYLIIYFVGNVYFLLKLRIWCPEYYIALIKHLNKYLGLILQRMPMARRSLVRCPPHGRTPLSPEWVPLFTLSLDYWCHGRRVLFSPEQSGKCFWAIHVDP